MNHKPTQASLSLFVGVCALLLPALAFAHAGHSTSDSMGGFISGFTHPIFGWDHLLAMLAVGIWGAQMGGNSVWSLPIAFPMVMAAGGALGAMKVPLPGVEWLIALSMVGLGLAVMLSWKPKEWMALVAVSGFAVFHGYAHGAELPSSADPVSYGMGFVSSTGLIHLVGIVMGLVASKLHPRVVQGTGLLIGAAGCYGCYALLG